MDIYVILGSAVVGLLVGLTGAGGGALMTPMLILLFSVKPSTAISSDLVAAVVMRPVGALIHHRSGSVNLKLVVWMTAGSVPGAFAGSYLLHLLGNTHAAQLNVERGLGAALLLGTAAMMLRQVLDHRSGVRRDGSINEVVPRPLLTVGIGVFGGLIVGLTSVGAGSLMIVLLMFLYPSLGASQLVGTDLAQAMPLTAAAALGALAFGHIAIPVTSSIIIGSIPAVVLGSVLSSRVSDSYLRPVIGMVVFASGLKYIGLSVDAIAWVLAAAIILVVLAVLYKAKPWTKDRSSSVDAPSSVRSESLPQHEAAVPSQAPAG